MGALTEAVRRHIPASYRAMIGPSEQTDYYSLSDLQSLADYVQEKLLATVVGATLEATSYSLLQIEFMGKVTTLKFIPAAIDYWLDQQETATLTGSNEQTSFPSRLAHLRDIYAKLAADVLEEFPQIAEEAGFIIRGLRGALPQVSYGDAGRGVLLTPDPQQWISPKRGRSSGTHLPWED